MQGKIKVLVVDDEQKFMENMLRMLETDDYEVKGCLSGEEALEKLKHDDFDVVLLDMMMPGLYGTETLRRIAAGYPQTEVILVTGHANVDDAIETLSLGAFDYLLKPCSQKLIIEKITQAMENKKFKSETLAKPQA